MLPEDTTVSFSNPDLIEQHWKDENVAGCFMTTPVEIPREDLSDANEGRWKALRDLYADSFAESQKKAVIEWLDQQRAEADLVTFTDRERVALQLARAEAEGNEFLVSVFSASLARFSA